MLTTTLWTETAFNTKMFREKKTMNYTNFKDEASNNAILAGQVCGDLKKSHEIDGEKFFEFAVKVKRLSLQEDIIPVTISERTLMNTHIGVGDFVDLKGEYRSYNRLAGEHSKLILHFFAKEIAVLSEEKNVNELRLSGYVCKEPIYRKTPFEREICDVLLAVNRANYRKSDYIPCILWGRNARFMAEQSVGCKVEIVGRIQSREYTKKLDNGESEVRTAYEVSCQSVAILGNLTKLEQKELPKVEAVNN